MALAGGISVTLPQAGGYIYQEGGVLSKDGHCRPFDADGAGTVVGNGVGIVVLKRLADAVRDGDYIHAVIKGSAINNDGREKVGYTAPSVEGQAAVIRQALGMAVIEPETIMYVETHGTGTPLGDPVEVAALALAHGDRDPAILCALGALKASIGHLDAAAGIAGLIKTVLVLQHKEIPPNPYYNNPNPNADLSRPFYINRERQTWHSNGPRRAGVSSFGIGGTNAHVILEEAPSRASSTTRKPWQLLVLSAKTPSALENVQRRLAANIGSTSHALEDVAHTLQIGRRHHAYRRMVVCRDIEHAAFVLSASEHAKIQSGIVPGKQPKLVFMFPGQGAQKIEMGRELWQTEPVFAEHLEACCRDFETYLGVDVKGVIYPSQDRALASSEYLCETLVAQPALFAVEYALAKLLNSWGIRPDAMIGHSLGEYVCACLSGVFSLGDAIRIVSARARLMQELPPGAMLAVGLSAEQACAMLSEETSIASINAPDLCVISGTQAAIDLLAHQLRADGVYCDQLKTTRAFHSDMVNPMLADFGRELANVKLNSPEIPFISNVTGTWITPVEATSPEYWLKHLWHPVLFSESLRCASHEGASFILEVGPGRTLSTLARRNAGIVKDMVSIPLLPGSQDRDYSERYGLLCAVGQLWLSGAEPCWHKISDGRRVPLPTYPFERVSCWPTSVKSETTFNSGGDAVEGDGVADWCYIESWRRSSMPGLPLQNEKQRWLIFKDRLGVGEEIAARLRVSGCSVVTVELADSYQQLNESHYCIPNADRSHYNGIISGLLAKDWLPDKILHLFNLTEAKAELDFDRYQEIGFYSLLGLIQALAQCERHVDLLVGTAQICLVTGEERITPELAPLLGLAAVVPHEYRSLTCRLIDVAGDISVSPLSVLADHLIRESTTSVADTVVAYRGGYRWVRAYERLRPSLDPAGTMLIKKGGAYLVLGELGETGLVIAEMLARSEGITVVLTTRRKFPAREEWSSWLQEGGGEDAIGKSIRRIQKLERKGCRILVSQGDIGDEAMLSSLFADLEASGLVPLGVFVTAGVEKIDIGQKLGSVTRENCERHFEIRAHSLYVLRKVLAFRPLDFVILSSSLSSILGGIGLAAYAASNSFVDMFSEDIRREGNTPWLTINWDDWIFETTSYFRTAGLSPAEGSASIEMLLGMLDAGRVLVSKTDLNKRGWMPKDAVHAEGIADCATGLIQAKNYVAPTSELEQRVVDVWEKILGVRPIGILDDFFELGGHSLLATQVVSELRDSLQLDIPLRRVFEVRTVSEMSLLIEEIFVGELEALPEKENNE